MTTQHRIPKGESTRQRILETAFTLFQQEGYEKTTMRLIAERAGLSLGNSYHYFPSKDHFILSFYQRLCDDHIAACEDGLNTKHTLRSRLLFVTEKRIDTVEPYHKLSGELFRFAADPTSPLNPFSADSQEIRDRSIAFMATVVDGAREKYPDDVQKELPRMLWLFHMGLILYWLHDTSANRERTRRLAEDAVELIMSLLGLAKLPLMRKRRTMLLNLIAEAAADETRAKLEAKP